MNNSARGQLDNEMERTKPKVGDGQEVARPDVLGVILQEDRPGMRGGLGGADAGHIFLNGLLGDHKTELVYFLANAFGPPQAILLRQLLDQCDGLRGQFGTTAINARFELAEEAES